MRVSRLVALMLSIATSAASLAETPSSLPRREFARRMATIHRGMSASEVRDLLGPPDEVLTGIDAARRYPGHGTREVWCYGTSGHLMLPTLGLICMTPGKQVMVDPMRIDAPLPPADFNEGEMRNLLLLIDGIADEQEFDPQTLIAAVNTLHARGRETALVVVEESARINPTLRFNVAFKLSWILQILFDYRPRLPVILVDGVPFLPGFPGGGSGPPPQAVIYNACAIIRRDEAPMRSKPLEPITDLRKLHADLFKSVPDSDRVDETRMRVNDQFARLASSVYQMPLHVNQGHTLDDWWSSIDNELAKLSVRWDAASNQYVRQSK